MPKVGEREREREREREGHEVTKCGGTPASKAHGGFDWRSFISQRHSEGTASGQKVKRTQTKTRYLLKFAPY